jgi:hypothetical protein
MAVCISGSIVAAKLKALRGPGESYSDVILRVAKGEGGNLTTTHWRHTKAPARERRKGKGGPKAAPDAARLGNGTHAAMNCGGLS